MLRWAPSTPRRLDPLDHTGPHWTTLDHPSGPPLAEVVHCSLSAPLSRAAPETRRDRRGMPRRTVRASCGLIPRLAPATRRPAARSAEWTRLDHLGPGWTTLDQGGWSRDRRRGIVCKCDSTRLRRQPPRSPDRWTTGPPSFLFLSKYLHTPPAAPVSARTARQCAESRRRAVQPPAKKMRRGVVHWSTPQPTSADRRSDPRNVCLRRFRALSVWTTPRRRGGPVDRPVVQGGPVGPLQAERPTTPIQRPRLLEP
jgi:hypothetical protein